MDHNTESDADYQAFIDAYPDAILCHESAAQVNDLAGVSQDLDIADEELQNYDQGAESTPTGATYTREFDQNSSMSQNAQHFKTDEPPESSQLQEDAHQLSTYHIQGNEEAAELHELHVEANRTRDFVSEGEHIHVSKPLAQAVRDAIDVQDKLWVAWTYQYSELLEAHTGVSKPKFDRELHERVMVHLLRSNNIKSQPALLFLMLEVGLKIGLKITGLQIGDQTHQQRPRLIEIVKQLSSHGEPGIHGNTPPEGTWYLCRLSNCPKHPPIFKRRSGLDNHIQKEHGFSHTEVFEVLTDTVNENLQTRFGPYSSHEIMDYFEIDTTWKKG